MIRLGIIGTESSHTVSILNYLKEIEDVELTAICGENREATDKVLKQFHLDCEVASPEEMIGRVDGVMLTMRDGAEHLKAVRPLFGHDIAIWIDKPFTASVADAIELLSLIEKHHTPFSGGTFIKLTEGVQAVKKEYERIKDHCMSGYLSFWTQLESPYSGMHFYSHHLIESVLEAFGCEVRSVLAKRTEDSLSVIAAYDGFQVLMNYGVHALPLYGGVFGSESSFMTEFDFGDANRWQLEEFFDVIKTGKSPYPPEFFLTAVKMSNAIEQSMKTGREILLEEVK